jgi:hypothetical protein
MPTTSPFFSNTTGYSGEQSLVDDLVTEQIALTGVDIYYMPRKHLNLDRLLHEASKSVFEVAMSIPMYIKSFSGYQNGMELLTKFGVRSSDEVTLVMSRSQFEAYYAPYLQSYYQSIEGSETGFALDKNIGHTAARPKEGDLIYFPFDDGIFEIKYVMFDQPFFQLGKGYVFEIQCEKFEYSGETFETGIEEIDDSMVKPDYYRMELTLDNGQGSFTQFEKVKIYDVSAPVAGEESLDFRLYDDPGFLEGKEFVTATVMEYDARTKKLVLGDIDNIDPDQQKYDTGQIEINKFDSVLVEGVSSKAVYYTSKAEDREFAFQDNKTIQSEFNEIKIIDPGDENPFGFY